jgi:GTP-binding protein
MKVPTVALVGRPNVGKSSLFNRMLRKKVSIIENTPGITRDRIYGVVNYNDYKFNLIDTGGIDISTGEFNLEIKVQAEIAIDEFYAAFQKRFDEIANGGSSYKGFSDDFPYDPHGMS